MLTDLEIRQLYGYKTEEDFRISIKNHAVVNGWLFYHTYNSRRSDKGYPDCTFVRDGRIVFAELKLHKKGTVKGDPAESQVEWINELYKVHKRSPKTVEVYVWRPRDWDIIEQVLA